MPFATCSHHPIFVVFVVFGQLLRHSAATPHPTFVLSPTLCHPAEDTDIYKEEVRPLLVESPDQPLADDWRIFQTDVRSCFGRYKGNNLWGLNFTQERPALVSAWQHGVRAMTQLAIELHNYYTTITLLLSHNYGKN